MKDLGVLFVRLVVGVLLAGHGSQKLFGWFKGPGIKGTGGFMEKLGMSPGHIWGPMAAIGEFTGGTLTALGLFHPLGPQNIASAMTVASRRAHWGKPIWASEGGAELPLTNLAAAMAIAAVGPGRYSLDSIFGIRLPKWLVALSWINTIAITVAALYKPEVAQTVVQKATQITPLKSVAGSPDLQVETVSTVPNTAEQKETAGI